MTDRSVFSMSDTARWLIWASSAVVIIGIAPSQILLGLALLAMALARRKPRLPPIRLPLGLFLLGTLIAILFSGDPAEGWPQIKKIYVFFQLLAVFTLLSDLRRLRWLVLAWVVLGAASALLGFVQFVEKAETARALGVDFYDFYVGERITGFMSHWYTFSAVEMFALLMLLSFLLFSASIRRRMWVWCALAAVLFAGILLAETRSVWIAETVGGSYLIWSWRRKLLLLAPVAVVAAYLIAPGPIRQRATSIFNPTYSDSNQFRVIAWRTGLAMIEHRPLLGLGPEMTRVRFHEFIPDDIPRPLPPGAYIHVHNLYLHYAAERGIPTLLVFLWLMGKILRDFRRGLRVAPPGLSDQRALLQGGIACTLAALADGVANVNLGDSEVLAMFLAIVGAGYLAIEEPTRRNDGGVAL